MSKISSKNTKPEITLRKELWKNGLRYRIHYNLPGKPDLAIPKHKIAIFVDGCFWHKCPRCYKQPKSNIKFWKDKVKKNVNRDIKNRLALENMGFVVFRIWEHEINENLDEVVNDILEFVNSIK